MKERDEITTLFRSHLTDAEMTVREGFWEELQDDLAAGALPRRGRIIPMLFSRVAAAASVLLLLGVASAAIWHFSPEEEINDTIARVAHKMPESRPDSDVVQEDAPAMQPSVPATPSQPHAPLRAGVIPAALSAQAVEEEEEVSVHVSITIREEFYGKDNRSHTYVGNRQQAANYTDGAFDSQSEGTPKAGSAVTDSSARWAWKAAIGTSLPKGEYHAPLTAGVSVERRLNEWLSLEAGLQYNRLEGEETLHVLGIPVKLNALLASSSRWDLYAQAGGTAEKCIGGAPDNSFDDEPVQLSLLAGVGVRYRVNDRLALFAEPSVSHYFDTDSSTRSLRTERSTNMNLLCGVRMTY